jgi:uncharacterized Zn-binding protein involved in type VI secretion
MPVVSVQGDTSTHGGAPFNTGLSTNVKADNKAVAVSGQTTSTYNDNLYHPTSHPQGISANQKANAGSDTVKVNNKPIHRIGDARIDGATAGPGVPTVKAG